MSNITITVSQGLLLACVGALKYQAHCEAGVSQAPDLFNAADTLEWSQALQLRALIKQASMPEFREFEERQDVLAFQQKFSVPMAEMPSFLDAKGFQFRLKFLQEELDEFARDHATGDMHGAADALVDLTYVLHGTALMMGLPWAALWDEVQRANMAKVRALHAGESKRGSALDVIKPEGWKAPDHTAALGVGPWPTLETESPR